MPKDETISSTPAELAIEIRMTRSAYPIQTILIVEGPTDKKFLMSLVVKDISIIPAGKDKALKVVRKLDSKPIDGVLAILDADFALIVGSLPTTMYVRIFLTDTTDLETMLFQSPALEKVIRHTLNFTDRQLDQVDNFCKKLREIVLKLSVSFGYLRLVDHQHRSYNLSLTKISFKDVIDFKRWEVDIVKVVDAVWNSNKLDKKLVISEIEYYSRQGYNPWHVCQGHEVLAIASVVLSPLFEKEFKSKLAGHVIVQIQANELSRTLRMAYELAFFKNTQLYTSLKKWEVDNPSFKVLKD